MPLVRRPEIPWLLRWIMVLVSVVVGLGAMAASVAADQKPGIFIPASKQVGMTGKNLSPALTNYLAKLLFDKYACADTLTAGDIANLLGWAKDQQLLGTPEEQAIQLQDIASAMGRTGVIVETTFGQLGDSYYVNVSVIDARTGTVVDNKSVSGDGDDDSTLLGLIDELVDSLEIRAAQCRWTGAITVVETTEWNSETSAPGTNNVVVTRNARTVTRTSDSRTDEITALVSNSRESQAGEVTALVTRTYKGNSEMTRKMTGEVDCARGWTAMAMGLHEYHGWSDLLEETFTTSGSTAEEGGLSIEVDRNGHYKLYLFVPALSLKATWFRAIQSFPEVCGSMEESSSEESYEDSMHGRDFSAEGDVDPQNRDVITGSVTTTESLPGGELGLGTKTVTKRWYLQRSGR